jgi:hypothetical protein
MPSKEIDEQEESLSALAGRLKIDHPGTSRSHLRDWMRLLL